MTHRFEKQNVTVTVKPQNECFVSCDELVESEVKQLPKGVRYWIREIVLFGDTEPWLLGRTIIPEETLTRSCLALVDLGAVLLGHYLFNDNNLTLDYLHLG